MAYSGHNGVTYSRWDNTDGQEPTDPEVDSSDCQLEELYYDSYTGTIDVTVQTPDGFLSIQIPVQADSDWNEFVDSLPKWE